MAKQKYLVTGRVFGKNGESLDGQQVEKEGDVNHPAFTKVDSKQSAKKDDKGKLEVASPKK